MTDASDTSSAPAAPAAPSKRRPRRIGAVVATVLAVVLFLVATTGIWAKRTVLSTDRVVAAVDAAAERQPVSLFAHKSAGGSPILYAALISCVTVSRATLNQRRQPYA